MIELERRAAMKEEEHHKEMEKKRKELVRPRFARLLSNGWVRFSGCLGDLSIDRAPRFSSF